MNDRKQDGFHVASLAHAGRLWSAWLEFDDDPHAPRSYRARLRFKPAAPGESWEPIRTAVIIIEPSYEEAMAKARAFDEHQLAGLLRSALPEDWDEATPGAPGTGPAGEDEAGEGSEGDTPLGF